MKTIITTLLTGAFFLGGCSKWLDVKPEAQSTKDEIFQTQKGFRDALTGAYIHLKSTNTYGGSLTWGAVEYLARNWEATSNVNAAYSSLASANYTNATVRTWIDAIYADQYRNIADVNSILERIDSKKTIFTENNYALIKGEALAIRAFVHFDVLRMYGPMPNNPGTTAVLPYVKSVSLDVTPWANFQLFAQNILADLDAAEALMKDVDPFTVYSMNELNQPDVPGIGTLPVAQDNYYMYRQLRFNYFAVLALKARVYNWLVPQGDDNRAKAAQYAQMVIDAKDRKNEATFRLGRELDRSTGDFLMSPEHIMAISEYKLAETAVNTFGETGTLVRSDFNIQDGYYYLNNLFPVAQRTSDVRWVGMWPYKTTPGQNNYVMYRKFIQKSNQPFLQIPLIRLSEMYLILTECATSKAEAEGIYTAYCSAKGIPFANGFNAANWQTDRRNKMIREYVREFYAEGQTFFTYKRYNVTSLPAGWTTINFQGTPAKYIVPKPDREINYNNK